MEWLPGEKTGSIGGTAGDTAGINLYSEYRPVCNTKWCDGYPDRFYSGSGIPVCFFWSENRGQYFYDWSYFFWGDDTF